MFVVGLILDVLFAVVFLLAHLFFERVVGRVGATFDFDLVGLSLVSVALVQLVLERDEFELVSEVRVGVFLARLSFPKSVLTISYL